MQTMVKMSFERGVLIGVYPDNAIVDIETAKQNLKDRIAFTKGLDYPALCISKNIKMTPEAQNLCASELGCTGVTKLAFLAENYKCYLLIKLHILWHQPKRPFDVFTSKEKAMEWLTS